MNELRHHGVKGMKWGVRKDRSKTGKTPRKKRLSAIESDYVRGKEFVEKMFSRDARAFASDGLAFASAAAWIAAEYAAAPIAPYLSIAAAFTNMGAFLVDPD